jgi:hypothetical protein
MHASPGFRLLFAVLLALSVGGKLVAGPQSLRGAEQTMQGDTKGQIAVFLSRHGFRVGEIEDQPDSLFVSATAGECRLLAVLAAPGGWHRYILRRLASPQDQVFFVFDATIYQDQPIWRPWVHHYWQVFNLYVGRHLPTQAVLGMVASPACTLGNMPWRELTKQ